MNGHSGEKSIERLEFGEFSLSLTPLRLTRNGGPVRLRTRALRLLALLASRPGDLLRHEEIHEALWAGRVVDFSGGVHVCVRQIRAALDDNTAMPRFVETVPRLGYRFVAPVRRIGPADAGDVAPTPSRGQLIRAFAAAVAPLAFASFALIALLPGRGDAPAGSAHARDSYLRGRYLVVQGSPNQVARGAQLLRAALEADDGYLPAHLGLAEAHLILGELGSARQHAERALSIAPGSAEAHVSVAMVLMEADWNWDRAGMHLERAIQLDPDSPKARQVAAARLAIIGELPRALEQMDIARRLDPVSTLIRADHGWLHYYAGRHADAVASCRQALDLDARLVSAELCIERAATAMGDHATAAAAALRIMKLWGASAEEVGAIARVPAVEASRAFHEWRLRFYATYPDQSQISADDMADASASVGRFEDAMSQLERAAAARSRVLPFLLADPLLAPLRGEARFAELRARLNLAPAA